MNPIVHALLCIPATAVVVFAGGTVVVFGVDAVCSVARLARLMMNRRSV